MKVLHINNNYLIRPLHQVMIDQMGACNIENDVFVPTYSKRRSVVSSRENVVISECFDKWNRAFFDLKQKRIYTAIKETFDAKSFNLIHAYTLFTDGNVAMKLSNQYGVPYVVAIRNTDVNVFFKYMFHLRHRGIQIMRNAAAVFFLSEAYKREVFTRYIPKRFWVEFEAKSHVIPNGIDDFWLQNMPPQKSAPNFKEDGIKLIYAGEITKNKNIEMTQRAMSILRSLGYKVYLTVVGNIVEQKVYKSISQDAFTVYIPRQPKEKLIELYRQNDIFVMPSITESFGLVYAEALSQGLPVIYTKGQGFDGQFLEGKVGYHVDSKSPGGIATAIQEVCCNYINMSESVPAAAQNFNWKKICKEYVSLYHSICNHR